jgi:hypothetical protein
LLAYAHSKKMKKNVSRLFWKQSKDNLPKQDKAQPSGNPCPDWQWDPAANLL